MKFLKMALFLSLILLIKAEGSKNIEPEAPNFPNGYAWGCYNISANLPFCNPNLSFDDRINDLISRLNLTEKLGLLGPNTVSTKVNPCNFMDSGVLRLGNLIFFLKNLMKINK